MQTSSVDRVRPVASLEEFFRDSVDQAMQRQGLQADDQTSHYVVNLLTLYSRAEALYEKTQAGLGLKPLALMLAEAADTPNVQERAFALQRIGDVSLFIAGFFADSLARHIVDIDYYIHMGGGAYDTLSQQVRGTPKGRAFGPVFSELAFKFKNFVDVLNDVRAAASSNDDQDVLRLYEIWLRTGSKRVEKLLRDLGVEPNATVDTHPRH
jgi:hypothetical protein